MPRTITFNIPKEYKLVDLVGEGSYGIVCSATHLPTGNKVAIKRIRFPDSPPSDDGQGVPRLEEDDEHDNIAKVALIRTIREIKILSHFNNHENIITIFEKIKPMQSINFKEIYLVQELMETDLSRILASSNTLTVDHIQYFLYQILRALKAIHSAKVIHRDLKPSNILLNSNCDLKICDFGLARTYDPDDDASTMNGNNVGFLTEYVATRWYRAPEIMLNFQDYSTAIDIWSCGCVLAEMLFRKPIFPGKDYHHQLLLILDTLGTPSREDIEAINYGRAKEYILSLPHFPKKDWSQLLGTDNEMLLDILDKLMIFNPKRRITAEQALEHPFLATYHDPKDEPNFPPLNFKGDEFWQLDNCMETSNGYGTDDSNNLRANVTRRKLREILYQEMVTPAPR
ncbi:Serine/Threonine protein kinases active-site signature [Nakaseomyces glabratus]|nr:Serine/Threonine protein kinases active-site signature [Nakaseomyces glabratus]KAH7596108.1 Serine/Threonine protein kinases active-site signature [Nakaseomyces glabratus]KAH7611675.1 Serine/Threonine protein kinases active-site signature [Nakaseomyces glabratus]